MHIALLDTDAPIPSFYSTHGLYSSRFRSLLHAAASRLSTTTNTPDKDLNTQISIHTSSYDVVGGCLPPLEHLAPASNTKTDHQPDGINNNGIEPITAILVTGSSKSAYDAYPWIASLQSFLHTVYTSYPHIKLFGSCFGHQIIAQSILPECVVEACPQGFEVGIVPINLTDEFLGAFPRLGRELPMQGKLRIQLVHGDRVVSKDGDGGQLPSGWVNLGSTDICPIQGLYYPNRVLTYQGHFEFDRVANGNLAVVFGARLGWSPEMMEQFQRQIESEGEDDSEIAGEIVLMFFLGLH